MADRNALLQKYLKLRREVETKEKHLLESKHGNTIIISQKLSQDQELGFGYFRRVD